MKNGTIVLLITIAIVSMNLIAIKFKKPKEKETTTLFDIITRNEDNEIIYKTTNNKEYQIIIYEEIINDSLIVTNSYIFKEESLILDITDIINFYN